MRADTAALQVDEAWYGRTYPAAVDDVARGLAADLGEHYHRYGRARGYLPYATAARPDHPAAHRSRFGGLWVDLGNAFDILNGKLELGVVTAEQHAALAAIIRDGYAILPGAVPEPILSAARDALERAYRGEDPGQWFNWEGLSGGATTWTPKCLELPAKAVEIHARSEAIRDAIFAPAVSEFLAALFERPALATQTLGFWRGSAQDVHQDSAYVGHTSPMQFVASWIALEDVTPGAGELCYYPGSQTFPDFLYGGEHKTVFDAARSGRPPAELGADQTRHEGSFPHLAAERGLTLETFRAKAGDVLIWAADLAHGGRPISSEATRKSVVTHYCPREIAPTYFEQMTGRELRRHRSGHYFTTFVDTIQPRLEPSRANLEIIGARRAAGWAAGGSGPLTVEVWSRGRRLGVATADEPRPDVAESLGFLGQRSGFELALDPANGAALSEVEIRDSRDGRPIGVWAVSPAPEEAPTSPLSPFPKAVAELWSADEDLSRPEAQAKVIERLTAALKGPEVAVPPDVAGYVDFLRAVWAHFQHVAGAFPETNEFRTEGDKDYRCRANTPDELISIAHHLYVLRSYGVEGDFAEFGCFKGFSTAMLSRACALLGLRMHVFDSFAGLPASESAYYQSGDFAGSLAEVQANVAAFGSPEAVTYHSGFFSESLARTTLPPLIGLWMDVDLESSARDVMTVADRLDPRAALFSHECTWMNFREGSLLARRDPDSPVGPILDRFAAMGEPPTGRFLAGYTGAFWRREGAHSVLANKVLRQLIRAL